ncbi:MAG: prephenate dehydrogenase/arogenate dehydrogenase family protein [Planctomycetota bacterium]
MSEQIKRYETVSILGLGLIGGAVGIRALQTGAAGAVRALVRRPEVIDLAYQLRAADIATLDPKEAVSGADLVIVCASVSAIPNLLKSVLPHLEKGCVVTDVGSTKKVLLDRCAEVLKDRPDVELIGSHPISGTEKQGLAYAPAVVLPNHLCVIVPTANSTDGSVQRLAAFWRTLGMTIKTMDAVSHDKALALASHAPHYVASALMAIQTDESMFMSAGGLRDSTRVAESDPALWTEIAMENGAAVSRSLRALADELQQAANWIDTRDSTAFHNWFRANHDKRVNAGIRHK